MGFLPKQILIPESVSLQHQSIVYANEADIPAYRTAVNKVESIYNVMNSSFETPLFDEQFTDWRLTLKSPAKNAGENLSYYGLDFTDRYGVKPAEEWHIGAYQKLSDKVIEPQSGAGAKLLYSENFAHELKDWKGAYGAWVAKDGKLLQTTVAGRTLATYTGGYEWDNYMFTGEVASPLAAEGNCTGIVFRADKSMNNFYTFMFKIFIKCCYNHFSIWK